MENELILRGTIGWSIDDYTVRAFLSKMAGADIVVRLHTFGGSVFEGNLIYNSIQKYAGKKTLIIEGVCASMGSIIMSAFDEVQIVRNGVIMIHTPWGSTEGNASAHESSAKLLRIMEKNFKEVYSKRTEYDLNTLMDGTDHWFDAEEALANGFVDVIIEEIGTIDLTTEAYFKGFETQIAYIKEHFQAKMTLPTSKTNENQKPIIQNNQNQIKMKKIIALLLGFGFALSMEASEEEVSNLIKAKFKEKDDELNSLKAELQKQVEEAKKGVIANALKAKQINQEQHDKFLKIADKLTSVEDVTALLETAITPVSIVDLISKTPQSEGRENWDWNDYQEKDVKALEKMEIEDPKAWQKLYDAEYKK